MPLPFRFGVLAGRPRSRLDLVGSARLAEDAGFSTYLVSDHLAGGKPAPFPALSVVAEATGLRVGTLVLGNDFRHPAQVAKEAATVDLLSDGRLELGVGTGWLEDDYRAAGLDLDAPGTRVDRLVEAVAVIEGFWSGERFRFRGEHYRVDVTGAPRPLQRPRPPLLIAGSGRRLLRLAAVKADIVSITATVGERSRGGYRTAVLRAGETVEERIAWIRGVGTGPEVNVLVHHLSITGERAAEAAVLAGEAGTDPETVLRSPHVLVGTVDQIVETLLERRERLGISYVVVGEEEADRFAPVVERLSGR